MNHANRLSGGFHALFRQGRVEQELDDELRSYPETSIDPSIALRAE